MVRGFLWHASDSAAVLLLLLIVCDSGRLSPGAKADIVLVDLDKTHIGPVAADDPIKALVYCARGDDVDSVIIDGITRLAKAEVLGLDLSGLRAGADQFNSKLRTKVAESIYRGRSLAEFYGSAFPDWEEVDG